MSMVVRCPVCNRVRKFGRWVAITLWVAPGRVEWVRCPDCQKMRDAINRGEADE